MVHLLPHWTHPGKEGVKIPVVVYTNCQSAELFLNEKSLGEKIMGEERQLVWQVPYEAGEIKVLARTDGAELCMKSFTTAGQAKKIVLSADRNLIRNNRADVVHIEACIADASGEMLPDADQMITFEISGPAKLLGVENGDILDLDPHKVNYRRAFKGKCLLIIQASGEQGTIEIEARAEELNPGRIRIVSGT